MTYRLSRPVQQPWLANNGIYDTVIEVWPGIEDQRTTMDHDGTSIHFNGEDRVVSDEKDISMMTTMQLMHNVSAGCDRSRKRRDRTLRMLASHIISAEPTYMNSINARMTA